MANPATAPKAMSTIGLKNLVIAPLTKDDETGVIYGDLQRMEGIIEATVTNENSDPDIQYADDIEFSVVQLDPQITITTTMTDVPLAIQEMILDNTMDNNGVLIKNAGDSSDKYFALGFMSEKSDHTYRYVWFYKVRANPITQNFATKEGEDITRQTPEIEWTAVKRTYDGNYQAVADEGQNGFTAEKAATFLNSVYEPVPKG